MYIQTCNSVSRKDCSVFLLAVTIKTQVKGNTQQGQGCGWHELWGCRREWSQPSKMLGGDWLVTRVLYLQVWRPAFESLASL